MAVAPRESTLERERRQMDTKMDTLAGEEAAALICRRHDKSGLASCKR